jgi:sugar phosphate isomerase/epimerase
LRASITSDMFNYSSRPSMERKLSLFAEHGFEYLHWCDDWNNDVLYSADDMSRYARLVESSGLRCLDVHGTATGEISIDAWDEGAQRAYIRLLKNRIEFCSYLGGDAVVVHPPRLKAPRLSSRLERSYEVLEAVEPICVDLGVCIAVENCYTSDDRVLEACFDRYLPEFLGFCLDSGHANLNGNLDRLFSFGDRLKVLHLHDNHGERDEHQPPFHGTIEWKPLLEWIKGCDYGKPLNFEVTHYRELFKGSMVDFLTETVASVERILRMYGEK